MPTVSRSSGGVRPSPHIRADFSRALGWWLATTPFEVSVDVQAERVLERPGRGCQARAIRR
ncbi:MAG: hypothetical protein K0Q71_5041 [Thermomicrobiales bacterium]|nr:hypothetical protein [Thermomicrobiales bacterium]